VLCWRQHESHTRTRLIRGVSVFHSLLDTFNEGVFDVQHVLVSDIDTTLTHVTTFNSFIFSNYYLCWHVYVSVISDASARVIICENELIECSHMCQCRVKVRRWTHVGSDLDQMCRCYKLPRSLMFVSVHYS